ncbi:MAG: C-terminal binding protein [Elusimicrobia bacterium]|nr:C-terminal binding protein [Elusimicrobiota bacterium]
MRFKVLIADYLSDPSIERELLGDIADVVCLGRKGVDAVFPEAEQADAVLLWHEVSLTAAAFDRMTRCRVVAREGIGTDNVDCAAAAKRGIRVTRVPDYGVDEVSNHALALLLSLERGVVRYNTACRASGDRWSWDLARPLPRARDTVLGLIGLGRIGSAVALKAKALGYQVLFHDPYKEDGYDKVLGVRRVDMAGLQTESDIVSIHCPLNDETRGLVGRPFLAACRRGLRLVNTARGGIVDLDALEEALRAGKVAGAGLDVLPWEPPDRSHPLIRAWQAGEPWAAERLVLTPHSAFYSEASIVEMRRKAALEVRRALLGEPSRNAVSGEPAAAR